MATPPKDLYPLLPESSEETMKCSERGKHFLFASDQTPRPRRYAKKWVCGTELPTSSNTRRIVACKRHAFSSNLRLCIFGLGLSK
jgi:hypothetical protein